MQAGTELFFAGLAKWPEQRSRSTWRSTKLPSPDQLLLAGDLVLVLESKLIKQFSIYFTECHCPQVDHGGRCQVQLETRVS